MKNLFRISILLAITGAAFSAHAKQPVAEVYKAKCAPCHGAAGDANTPAGKQFNVPSFSSAAAIKETDADLLAVAKNGKGKMPAWHDKLTDEQLQGLVGYIRTLQKNP